MHTSKALLIAAGLVAAEAFAPGAGVPSLSKAPCLRGNVCASGAVPASVLGPRSGVVGLKAQAGGVDDVMARLAAMEAGGSAAAAPPPAAPAAPAYQPGQAVAPAPAAGVDDVMARLAAMESGGGAAAAPPAPAAPAAYAPPPVAAPPAPAAPAAPPAYVPPAAPAAPAGGAGAAPPAAADLNDKAKAVKSAAELQAEAEKKREMEATKAEILAKVQKWKAGGVYGQ